MGAVQPTTETAPQRFAPAPLPTKALLLGAACVAVAGFATIALINDVVVGKAPWGASACLATMLFALGWVATDRPRYYELAGDKIVVQTWVRRWAANLGPAHRLAGGWKDRFAINGGFGWFGLFTVEGRVVRAFVTHPDFRVWIESSGRPTVISPANPEAFLAALRLPTPPPHSTPIR